MLENGENGAEIENCAAAQNRRYSFQHSAMADAERFFSGIFIFCSSVEEVPAAVGETKLLDKGADTRLNCQTALQTMSKIIL